MMFLSLTKMPEEILDELKVVNCYFELEALFSEVFARIVVLQGMLRCGSYRLIGE